MNIYDENLDRFTLWELEITFFVGEIDRSRWRFFGDQAGWGFIFKEDHEEMIMQDVRCPRAPMMTWA